MAIFEPLQQVAAIFIPKRGQSTVVKDEHIGLG
jgi:hypothetical protein